MAEAAEDGWVFGLEEVRSTTFHLGIGLGGYSVEGGAGGSSTPICGAYTIPTRATLHTHLT